jgi:rhamnosyltransferase
VLTNEVPVAPATVPAATRPKVLVLLAARNGSQWIRQQVQSVLHQQGVEVRVVIRDDRSTDTTPQQLRQLTGDPRVLASEAATGSGSAAQNFLTLIRENSADGFGFVAFADQDDVWDEDKLVRACRLLVQTGSVGYSSATRAGWPDGRTCLLTQATRPSKSDFLFEGVGQGCTFVMTADFYRRVRAFLSERTDLTLKLHYHDWAIFALARTWSLRWQFDPTPSMLYRQHSDNDTGARTTLAGVRKRLNLIRSAWYGTQLQSIAELCSAAGPDNPTVAAWRRTLHRQPGCSRRLAVSKFCLQGGRRRWTDQAILVFCASAGWI